MSPNRVKLQQLQEKLQNQTVDDDRSQASRLESYEQKLRLIDEKMSKAQLSEDTKFKVKMFDNSIAANERLDIKANRRSVGRTNVKRTTR